MQTSQVAECSTSLAFLDAGDGEEDCGGGDGGDGGDGGGGGDGDDDGDGDGDDDGGGARFSVGPFSSGGFSMALKAWPGGCFDSA